MGISEGTGARDEAATMTESATATQALLRFGVLVGPFYLVIGVLQGVVRDGFDFGRHALSHLANGPGGWIQTANFILSGLMVIAAAAGIARALKPAGRMLSWFLGAFGASMLVAAAFPADAVDGFPVGTPTGNPTSITTTGLVHFAAGGLGFTCLAVSCFLAARAMSRRNAPSLARLSFISGLAVLAGFFGPFVGLPFGIAGIWFAVVVGWAWLALVSHQLSREGASAP